MKKYTMLVTFEAEGWDDALALSGAAQEYLSDANSWLDVKGVSVDLPNEVEEGN